ncbi:MAG: hypothetical protein ACK51A_11965, partial [Sphingobacteriia bacterium]
RKPSHHLQLESQVRRMEVSDVQRLKELEAEHSRLKKMYAELSLVHDALKDALEKNGYGLQSERSSPTR